MKKLISIVLLMITCITISAQGKWSMGTNKGDELKGQKGGPYYKYDVSDLGSFVFWGWDEYQFRLVSEKGLFNTELTMSSGVSYKGLSANVGLYDDNDKLIDKFVMWLDLEENRGFKFVRTRDSGGMFNPVGQKIKLRRYSRLLNQERDMFVLSVRDMKIVIST